LRKICIPTQEFAVRLLTTSEIADYLRIKERKVYEMVSEAAIPCTKVMGKWLFPKEQIDRWLLENLIRPDGMTPADPMPIVGGSHDPLLEWALRESLSGLATLPEGSEAGLRRFVAGELVAAAVHLHALDDEDLDANVEAMKVEATLYDAVLIGFARREVGLLTAPGNPLGLRDLHDVAKQRARLAVRPEGAGAQLLLLSLLHRANALRNVGEDTGELPCGGAEGGHLEVLAQIGRVVLDEQRLAAEGDLAVGLDPVALGAW
jgi:excisionase family DNA binding protein